MVNENGEGGEIKMNGTQILCVSLLAVLYGICIPAYKYVNRKGFKLYLLWLVFIGVLWLALIFGTDICR